MYQQQLASPTTNKGQLSSSMSAPTKPQPFFIHVYRNGDPTFQGASQLVDVRKHADWSSFLDVITNRIDATLPVTKLYTIDGRRVVDFSGLVSREHYVACDRLRDFKPDAYGGYKTQKWRRVGLIRASINEDADKRNIRSYTDYKRNRQQIRRSRSEHRGVTTSEDEAEGGGGKRSASQRARSRSRAPPKGGQRGASSAGSNGQMAASTTDEGASDLETATAR